MKKRIITALMIIAFILPAILLGGNFLNLLVLILVPLIIHEVLNICKNPNIKRYMYLILVLFYSYGFIFERTSLFIGSVPVLMFLVILNVSSIFDDTLGISRMFYIFTISVLIVFGLHILYVVINNYGFSTLFLLALATYGSDTGAYFTGYFFGKNKLIPRLSPKKTVEGSIGGIVLGSALAILYGIYTGILNQYPLLITACVILTFTSQIGDLIFSAIKRRFDVKDYSQLLPGHGGVLDRLDSLLYNAIIMALFMLIAGVV